MDARCELAIRAMHSDWEKCASVFEGQFNAEDWGRRFMWLLFEKVVGGVVSASGAVTSHMVQQCRV